MQAIIRGMTPHERADPKIINASRRLRIANGSGVAVSEVNQLVDRFFEARKMMSSMAGGMGMPGLGRKSATARPQRARARRARRAAGARRRPRSRDPLGRRACPPGSPTCRNMPKGLDELPPGLADFDLSKLKFPGKK